MNTKLMAHNLVSLLPSVFNFIMYKYFFSIWTPQIVWCLKLWELFHSLFSISGSIWQNWNGIFIRPKAALKSNTTIEWLYKLRITQINSRIKAPREQSYRLWHHCTHRYVHYAVLSFINAVWIALLLIYGALLLNFIRLELWMKSFPDKKYESFQP